jgi:hypothetical protein
MKARSKDQALDVPILKARIATAARSSPLVIHSNAGRERIPVQMEAVAREGVRRRRRRAEPASSASIAANSFSMARADGAPSASLRWIVSVSSWRTRS